MNAEGITLENFKRLSEELAGRIKAVEDMQKSLEAGIKALGTKEAQVVADQLALQKERQEFEAKKTAEQVAKADAQKAAAEEQAAKEAKQKEPTEEKIHIRVFKFSDGSQKVFDTKVAGKELTELTEDYGKSLAPKGATLVEVADKVRFEAIDEKPVDAEVKPKPKK